MVAAEGEILSRGAARARTTERMAARYQLHVDEKVLHNGLIAAEDMDLRSNCDQNLEYQETVKRMYTPAPIGRDPRELGITTLPEDIKHLEGVPETMPLMKRSLRHVRNMFQNFSFIVYLALAMCLIGPANGIHLNHTNQLLPKECLSWMKANGNDCPEREHPVDDDWKLLNAKCCHAFQGTFLHCQTHLNQYSMLACMKDQKVPVGYKSILVTDKAGDPEVQLKRCKNDSFSSVATNSSYNRLPFCHLKSLCTGEGRELRCLGGYTKNDRCGCKVGYKPDPPAPICLSSFDIDRDTCNCIPLDCQDGYTATNNYNVPSEPPACSQVTDVPIRSWCALLPSTTLPTPLPLPAPTSTNKESTTPTTTSTDSTPKPNVKNSRKTDVGFITGIVVAIVLAILVVAALVKYRKQIFERIKNCCHCRNQQNQVPSYSSVCFLQNDGEVIVV